MTKIVIKEFEWHIHNISHIALHNELPSEVEEVSRKEVIILQSRNKRIVIIGKTDINRALAIVFEEIKNNKARTVTARDASRKERKFYQEKIGGKKTL